MPVETPHTPFQLARASYYAGCNNACSVPHIANALKIDVADRITDDEDMIREDDTERESETV